jgi:hypothetical protein
LRIARAWEARALEAERRENSPRPRTPEASGDPAL